MKKTRVFGGILLVSGTAIGAGMIALPITSGPAGFIPSFVFLLACWLYMMTTAFLFLEANLWLERDVNLVTMAQHTLGWVGKLISWIVYLFLLYTLTTAYLSGCGSIFIDSLQKSLSTHVPMWFGPIPFLILFGLCVYLGTRPSDYINRALMLGLVVSFATLGAIVTPRASFANLGYQKWSLIIPSISIMITSFGFHIIIPSLSYYLGYRKKLLIKTLFWGSLIPLIVYSLWQLMVLGLVPATGPNSLTALSMTKNPEVSLMNLMNFHALGIDVGVVIRFFTYFAILTSFLGVSLSLHDFLADGFKIEKNVKGRFLLSLMTFIPPYFFSIFFPGVFVSALQYAAIFVAILLGILPALMVWSGRYRLNLKGDFTVIGGRWTLIGVMLISLAVIVVDLLDQFF